MPVEISKKENEYSIITAIEVELENRLKLYRGR